MTLRTVQSSLVLPHSIYRPFYLLMSLLLSLIVILGFSQTVPRDFQPPGLPLLLKFHAAIFVTWVALFIAQPAFVFRGSVKLHRRLGYFGAVLAAAMVALASAAIILALQAHTLPPFYAPGLFLTRGLVSIAVFAGLTTAAIRARHKPDWHKRLILCAAIVVVGPALERALPVFLWGPHWYIYVDAVLILITLLGPATDLLERGRIHQAYLYGIGTILLGQAVTDLIAPSSFAARLIHALG